MPKVFSSLLIDNTRDMIEKELKETVEEGYNHIRTEASEIIAFVATNSNRIATVGVPPHLPIAYGLRGSFMPISVMLKYVERHIT